MTTIPLCPKTKLKRPVANSKSQATTLLALVRQWLHFPPKKYLSHNIDFKLPTSYPLEKGTLPQSASKMKTEYQANIC